MNESFRDHGTEHDARLTALYRAVAGEEPPPALDDSIRAAARRAVSSRPRVAGLPFSHSWRVPLSIAAVVLLSVSLVTVMREEAPETALPSRAALPRGEMDHRQAAPAVDAGESATTTPKNLVPYAQRSDRVGLKPPLQSQSPGIGIRGNTVSPESVTGLRKEMAGVDQMGAGAVAEGKVQSKSEPVSAERANEPSRARVKAAPAVQPSALPPAAQMAGVIQPRADLPPDKWLERIEELRKQGKLGEAKTSLMEFRKRYPGYELPASLKDWAEP